MPAAQGPLPTPAPAVTLPPDHPAVTPFPDPADVFAERVGDHAALLLPLVSVDLTGLGFGWDGPVHWVWPACEIAAEGESDRPAELFRFHSYGFRVTADGRYAASPADLALLADRVATPWLAEEEAEDGPGRPMYEATRDLWRRTGRVAPDRTEWGPGSAGTPPGGVSLGGPAFKDNWTNGTDWPLAWGELPDPEEDDEMFPAGYPLTPGGRAMQHVGDIEAWHFVGAAGSFVWDGGRKLFFDPDERIAAIFGNWS